MQSQNVSLRTITRRHLNTSLASLHQYTTRQSFLSATIAKFDIAEKLRAAT